jgi:hypothetical protein
VRYDNPPNFAMLPATVGILLFAALIVFGPLVVLWVLSL